MRQFMLRSIQGLAVAFGTIFLTGVASAQISVSVADFLPLEHQQSKDGVVYWINLVKERLGNKIMFTHYPAEQAAPAKSILDAVVSNTVNVGLVGTTYYTERLPLNSVLGLPGFYKSAEQGTRALQEMMHAGPLRDEFLNEGVVPIFSLAVPPYQILVRDKRLGMPSEWAGLSIRTGGTTQALTARALGAVGVSIPGPEIYAAVERGRVAGVMFPLSSVNTWKLQEVVKYISTNGAFGGFSQIVVINKKLFDELGAEIQEAMLDAGEKTALHLAKAQDDSIAATVEEWKKQGLNVYEFTPEELEAIAKSASSVREEWENRIGQQNNLASEVATAFEAKLTE